MIGDVIRLRLGDIVPADARLLDGDEIEVDAAADGTRLDFKVLSSATKA